MLLPPITRHYSPRTEQGHRRTMLPEAVNGPLREHLFAYARSISRT